MVNSPGKRLMKKKKKTTKKMARKASASGLPLAPNEPLTQFSDYSWLLYGEKKVGKTTLCSMMPDPLFIMTEPGGKALRTFQAHATRWGQIVKWTSDLQRETRFKTVIVDTVDRLYDLCFRHVCKERGVEYPPKNDFGQCWAAIKSEFEGQILKLLGLNRGIIFISHARTNRVEDEDDEDEETIVRIPTLRGQGMGIMEALVDVIGYYGYQGSNRVLVIRGNENLDAGCRLEENFLTTKGEPVQAIPMGESKEESYDQLMAAFNNELKTPGKATFNV